MDTGSAQFRLGFAGPACKIDMSAASGLQGLGGSDRLLSVDLVGGTEAGQLRTGGFIGRGEGGGIGKALGVDRFDPAGLEEALRKGRARGEIGGHAEIGEEN